MLYIRVSCLLLVPAPGALPDPLPRKPLILVLLSLAQLMIVLDFSIVNVALPSIQTQFLLPPVAVQWVVSAYAITFGGFLLLGGRASDLFNRKTTFLAGLTIFSIASLIGGFAPTATLIFSARALQGIGAAILSPSALSLVTTTFAEGHERNMAIGIFGSMAAIGFTTGVILGGVLTTILSWHWVFFVNVPLGILGIAGGVLLIPSQTGSGLRRGVDVAGAVLVTSSLILLVYAITQISSSDQSVVELGLFFTLSGLLVASFVWFERRACIPLVPADLFRRRRIAISDIIMFLTYATNAALIFSLTLFLQEVRGFIPLETGLIFISGGVGGITGAVLTPRLIRRIGYRAMILIGIILFAISIAALATIGGTTPVAFMLAYYYVTGVGVVTAIVSLQIAGTSGVEHGMQGLAAGLLVTAQQIGAAIGVSAASLVITAVAVHPMGAVDISTRGYQTALLGTEWFLLIAIILAGYLLYRGYLRGDVGIPGSAPADDQGVHCG